jgi:hypothetical protein
MPVCRDPQFVFVHIPKCAGTSITQAFMQSGCDLSFYGPAPLQHRLEFNVLWLHHTPARHLQTKLSENDWHSSYKFTVVRNPWERLVSLYHYRRRKEPVYVPVSWNRSAFGYILLRPRYWYRCLQEMRRVQFAPKYATGLREDEDFEQWLRRQMADSNFARAFSCSNYTCDREGRILVDEVIRQEDLEAGFAKVCKRLSLNATLPQSNASEHRDYRSYYTPALRDFVGERFSSDIQRFLFSF